MRRRTALALAALAGTAGCTSVRESSQESPAWGFTGSEYAVAADHELASRAGAGILAKGGNAVDAAVATSFALAVTRPYSAGLGGGGFMLIKPAGKRAVVLDYREEAPSGADASAYLDGNGAVIPGKTETGVWAIGVPGHVRGVLQALSEYGTMSRDEVMAPAIALAENGFPVDAHTHQAMEDILSRGKAHGLDAASAAEIAKAILGSIRRGGGPMTAGDLANYRVETREPLRGRYRGYEVLGMPPPSSGGACVVQVLQVLDGYPRGSLDAPSFYATLVEALKHAFADRAARLGDADVHSAVHADVAEMISLERAAKIRAGIVPGETRSPERYGIAGLKDDHGTTHYSVMDKDGNAVAATETVNTYFGSLVMAGDTGIVLNNELDDFSIRTDVPNAFGLLMSTRNVLSPGQRPLSSMSPTILLQGGEAVLAAGGSGGPRIITATLQAVLQIVEFAKTPAEAVALGRVHHQWAPNQVFAEKRLPREVWLRLENDGHAVVELPASREAAVQVVYRDGGRLFAASDPRKGGRPAGR